jgi:hypothetical protein
MRKLGVDCGSVILYPFGGIVPGAFESLEAIAQSGQFDTIYIVSRANIISRTLFLLRLRRLRFWEKTGIPRENIYFCLKNYKKIEICNQLGVTDFIDDRLSVLKYMGSLKSRFAFNMTKRSLKHYPKIYPHVTSVRSWKELQPLLLSSQK